MKEHPQQEDEWLWRYIKLQNPCHYQHSDSLGILNECSDNVNQRTEDDLDVALRTEYALIASQSMFLFGKALQNAWEDMCTNDSRQPCSELMKISHQKFYQSYFKDILQNQRHELKLPKDNQNWISGPRETPDIVLVKYTTTENYTTLSKVSNPTY